MQKIYENELQIFFFLLQSFLHSKTRMMISSYLMLEAQTYLLQKKPVIRFTENFLLKQVENFFKHIFTIWLIHWLKRRIISRANINKEQINVNLIAFLHYSNKKDENAIICKKFVWNLSESIVIWFLLNLVRMLPE